MRGRRSLGEGTKHRLYCFKLEWKALSSICLSLLIKAFFNRNLQRMLQKSEVDISEFLKLQKSLFPQPWLEQS